MIFEDILPDVDFLADENDPTVTYVDVEVPPTGICTESYKMFVEIDDARFSAYIRIYILSKLKTKTNATDFIQSIKDILLLGGNPDVVSPKVRTAGKLTSGMIEYDLSNPTHEYVKVTKKGWSVVQNSKYKFLKRGTLASQVYPQQTDKDLLTLLRPYVNMDEDNFLLWVAWLVQAFCTGNHICALLESEAGSGKSTLTRMVRRIVDPSKLNVTAMPEKKDDLLSALTNSYFIAYDNTEILSQEVSNIIAMAVTGAAVAKRKLYTTNDLRIYGLSNVVLLNGIDIMPSKSDLASRCLLFSLKAIQEESRKTDEEIEAAFEQALPEILGAIFDTLSKAMSIIKDLKPQKLPRMASAYKEMLAIAIALGVSEQKFESVFFANIAALNKARGNIAIVEAVQEYMNSPFVKGRFADGKVSDLYVAIRSNYSGQKSDLPNSPSRFGRKLREELKTFEAVGLTLLLDNTYADGTHLKIIKN